MDNVREMEVDLQNRERIFEEYQDKAKQILCRIEQLENEHQEEICSSMQTLESKGSHQKSYPVNKCLCCLQNEEQEQKRSTHEVCYNRPYERNKNEEHKLYQDDKIRKQFSNVAQEQSHNNPRHLNEKVKRQILFEENIPQEEIMPMTSKHLQINAGDHHSNEVVIHTKLNHQLLNSAYEEVIPTKYVRGLSKNEFLKAAIGNATDVSVNQSGHTKLPHSADKLKMVGIHKVQITNKSTGCESSKSDVQASEVLFKQPVFVVESMSQQIQNTEPIKLCSSTSDRGASCTFTSSVNPKVSDIRCSDHQPPHAVSCCVIPKVDLQTVQDTCLQEHSIKHKNCFKDQDLSENHAYSLAENEDAEIHLSNTPAIVFKKQQRRIRKDFTSEEISYLLEGVKKMGHHWNLILWSYPFQKGRTNVDLAKKYCKLQRNEKNKNM